MPLLTTLELHIHRQSLKALETGARPVLEITAEKLKKLPEYSATLPTGQTIGKRWKRNIHPSCREQYGPSGLPPERCTWIVGEFYKHPDPNLTGILWYDVEVVDE
jgi:hypothetical protein